MNEGQRSLEQVLFLPLSLLVVQLEAPVHALGKGSLSDLTLDALHRAQPPAESSLGIKGSPFSTSIRACQKGDGYDVTITLFFRF